MKAEKMGRTNPTHTFAVVPISHNTAEERQAALAYLDRQFADDPESRDLFVEMIGLRLLRRAEAA